MLEILRFGSGCQPPKVAILIKREAMIQELLKVHYLEPAGLDPEQVVAFNLLFNVRGKVPLTLAKPHQDALGKALQSLGISLVYVADTTWFKLITGTDACYGEIVETRWPGIQAVLGLNYQQLIYNPVMQERLTHTLRTLAQAVQGNLILRPSVEVEQLQYYDDILERMRQLIHKPVLTCDIECFSLLMPKAGLASIAFGLDTQKAVAFPVDLGTSPLKVRTLLKQFFLSYKGKLIFHNASFDTRVLIHELFMLNLMDMAGMLQGLHALHRDIEDTKLLAYLALNSTAGVELGLKDLSVIEMGNYALKEIDNVTNVPLNDLLHYNGLDCIATWHVYNKYRPVVASEQEEIYRNIFLPALKVVTQMEICGLPLDPKKVQEADLAIQRVTDKTRANIEAAPFLPEFEQKLRILQAEADTKKLKKKIKVATDYPDLKFNPGSDRQIRILLHEFFDLPVLSRTETGLPSTDADTLKKYMDLLVHQHGITKEELA